MKNFLSMADASRDAVQHVLDVSMRLRGQRIQGQPNEPLLSHQTLAMIFQKPSLRTRVSFEQAMIELGGHAIVLTGDELGMSKRESPGDIARVLGGMVHAIAARVFDHAALDQLAQHAPVPVINMLSDLSHPCQALADALTMTDEFGPDLGGRTVAFVGDGNNVARSLAVLCGQLGMNFVLASPPGYELDHACLDRIMAQVPGLNFELTHDPAAAVPYADVIYTDTWVSMGQEDQGEARRRAFGPYQINDTLLKSAPDHAIVMHCLPAYRNTEITDDVIDGPRSRVFPQAHNRLHAQKGLLAVLLGGQ